MPFNYNTQGITNPDANDPSNLGGSSGIMSSTANTTSNDDDNGPSFFESIANLFSGAGADLPSDNNDDGDSGASFYSGPMFGPFNNGSDDSGSDNNSSSTSPTNKPLPTSAADRAVYEALGIDVPEVYKGELGEWEAEPNINMDVLQKALQPDPIAVEEIEVKAGDTLSGIAKDKGVPVQDVINANPQIKNPDLIRPGEKVTVPDVYSGESTMERMARESAELAASKRDAAGITRSLTPEEVKKRNAALKADSEDPDRKFYQSTIPIEDRTFPAEAEQADGIMSPTNLSSRLDTKGETPVGSNVAPERGLIPALTSNVVISDPEMSFIVALEEFRESPYELNSSRLSPDTHRSGLTIANGFDVGQHDKATLKKMGLDDSTISKFSDWIGVNPDTIIDPNTNLPAANRVRGHQLMAEKFSDAKDAGTLPKLSYRELEQVSKGSYDVLGTDVAKRAFGPGFDDLDDDVKAVLTQEAYVRGKVNSTSIDRARQGLGALDVLDAMPDTGHLADRKRNAEQWLQNNTFSDDKQMSNQGIQMLTNLLIDDLGLQRDKIAVDSLVGRGTRSAVNDVLRAAGKTPPPANARGDARRKVLMEELANERLLPSAN